jgi:RsiW-degrading membrane proteinase PrsW (M82 family)
MLLLALTMGAGAFWALSYGEDLILYQITGNVPSLVAIAAVAGILEELAKLLIVIIIWFRIPRHFNDPFDGLIYGAMAGLGFAIAESIFYTDLMRHELTAYAMLGQEIVRLILHLLTGALTCVGLGLARFRVRGWPMFLLGGVAASMLIHFSWDYFCGILSDDDAGATQQRAIAIVLMLTALGLFGVSVVIGVKQSGDTHGVNKLRDLWGWPFTR